MKLLLGILLCLAMVKLCAAGFFSSLNMLDNHQITRNNSIEQLGK